jgi:hypothetical protein
MTWPSTVVTWTNRLIAASASRIWLPRWLAARNIRAGTPLKGVITATRLKITRAVGRDTRAKIRPVAMATMPRPVKASAVITMLP